MNDKPVYRLSDERIDTCRTKNVTMKKTLFGFIIFGIIATAALSFNSCSCGRQKGEAELDDSTKLALEMEKRLIQEPEFEMVTSPPW